MSDTVHTVTELASKPSVLKKIAKRGAIAAVAVGALTAALYLRAQTQTEDETKTSTT